MYHYIKYGKGDIIFDLVINSDAFVFPMDGVVAVNLEYEQYTFQTHLYHQVIQVERSTQGRMGYKLYLLMSIGLGSQLRLKLKNT